MATTSIQEVVWDSEGRVTFRPKPPHGISFTNEQWEWLEAWFGLLNEPPGLDIAQFIIQDLERDHERTCIHERAIRALERQIEDLGAKPDWCYDQHNTVVNKQDASSGEGGK